MHVLGGGGKVACKSPSSPPQEALAFSGGEVVGHQRDQPPQWAAARLPLINTGGRNHQELCGGTTPPCHGHGPKDESTWSFLCLTSQQCLAGLGFTPPKGSERRSLRPSISPQSTEENFPVTHHCTGSFSEQPNSWEDPCAPRRQGKRRLTRNWTFRTQFFCLLQVSCTAFESKCFKLSSILFLFVKITHSLQRHCLFQWWTTYSYTGMPTRVCTLTNYI